MGLRHRVLAHACPSPDVSLERAHVPKEGSKLRGQAAPEAAQCRLPTRLVEDVRLDVQRQSIAAEFVGSAHWLPATRWPDADVEVGHRTPGVQDDKFGKMVGQESHEVRAPRLLEFILGWL